MNHQRVCVCAILVCMHIDHNGRFSFRVQITVMFIRSFLLMAQEESFFSDDTNGGGQ